MKKIIYIDMDNVLVDFKTGIAKLSKDVQVEYEGHLDDVPGIFSLMEPMKGAIDATKPYRDGSRLVEAEGGTYLRPTVVHCDSMDHPLANREFLCPYASVVQIPQSEMLGSIGPTLVVTAITKDKDFQRKLLGASNVERLNLGPISTMKISWDQPHEGNMFEFLYKRRSIGMAA